MFSTLSMTTISPIWRAKNTREEIDKVAENPFPVYDPKPAFNIIFIVGAFILFLLMIRR